MENFSQISLGFAEFVAQLLQETFNATLSAQNHQIEKYLELENALKLPSNRFKDLYLSDEQLVEKELDIFGMALVSQMKLEANILDLIANTLQNTEGIVYQGKLTKSGFNRLKVFVLDSLVDERKDQLRELLNKTELTRLVVDSGEIKAKLELTNFSQDGTAQSGGKSVEPFKKSKAAKTPLLPPIKEVQQEPVSKLIGSPITLGQVKVNEIINSETNEKILLIDKSSVTGKVNIQTTLPNVRVVAKPASVNSNSSLLSEVTIKFKTA